MMGAVVGVVAAVLFVPIVHSLSCTFVTAYIPGVDDTRGQKIYQDACFVDEVQDDGKDHVMLWGVLDGHGKKGHIVADYMADQLPGLIRQQLSKLEPQLELEASMQEKAILVVDNDEKPSIRHQALRNAFHHVHWNAAQDPSIPAGRSGTTAVVAACNGDQLDIAHLGDSRLILLEASENNDDGYHIRLTTTETTCRRRPEEHDRISKAEGRIDAAGNVWYGPAAIASSRALGDAVMLRAGVIPTPIVDSAQLGHDKTTVAVMATDGIWDVLSNEQVCSHVSSSLAAASSSNYKVIATDTALKEAAETLCCKAREKWIGNFVDEKADDITCIMALFR